MTGYERFRARPRRRASATAIVLAAALFLAACEASTDSQPAPDAAASPDSMATGQDGPVRLPQIKPDAPEHVPSALDNIADPRLPKPLVSPALVLSGGPPPDGIPPLDKPTFQRVPDIDWLDDDEAVLALTLAGETRGYPVEVMIWHEIVNDTIGHVPVAVTYCPLCNSGVAFDRRISDRVLSFGTSGRLYNSNLVMYDRQTESLWPQLTGRASLGVLTGATLTSFPVIPVAWEDFRTAYPGAWVLARDTGYERPYGTNPYVAYDHANIPPMFDPGIHDERLGAKERVVALTGGSEAVAVVRAAVARAGVLTTTVDGERIVLFHRRGQASALDSDAVADGRDIGSVAVYRPALGRRELSFVAGDGGFVDVQTHSTWNILGEAIAGPLAGRSLEAYRYADTFWFVWSAFRPDTRVVDGSG